MKLSDFNYKLPPELIATEPVKKRDQSRLLILDKKTGQIEHKKFFNIIDYLQPGDLLIANNSKVIPARFLGKKTTGGEVEVFLSKPFDGGWECLIKGRVKAGTEIILSTKLSAKIIEVKGDGVSLVEFNLVGSSFMKEVEAIGHIPLPPYIEKQRGEHKELAGDKKNYQTVYAEDVKKGSVAAPTAGLHFTPELLKKIKAKGVGVEYLTLHVGLGTFLPVKTEKIEDHKIHSEYAEVGASLIKKIIATKQAGHRVIAVGTTTTRTLEYVFKNFQFSASSFQTISKSQFLNYKNEKVIKLNVAKRQPALKIENWKLEIEKPTGFCGWVDIFIYPPYKFKIVDALITNFHLPESTLLMLVSALAGKKNIDKAYEEAIKNKYRFYSYGDAMFIA